MPSGASAAACQHPAWPSAVGAQLESPTASENHAVHAWGDPAIIARCGVAALAPTTDPCVAVDGVGWVSRPLSDGTAFTTFGRDPALEVLIPKVYDPAPLLLPAFTAVAKTLPTNGLQCR